MNLLFRSPIKPDFNIQKEEKVEGGGGERERNLCTSHVKIFASFMNNKFQRKSSKVDEK